jgi:hypothetical protein
LRLKREKVNDFRVLRKGMLENIALFPMFNKPNGRPIKVFNPFKKFNYFSDNPRSLVRNLSFYKEEESKRVEFKEKYFIIILKKDCPISIQSMGRTGDLFITFLIKFGLNMELEKIFAEVYKSIIEENDNYFKLWWNFSFLSTNLAARIINLFQGWHYSLGQYTFFDFIKAMGLLRHTPH